jgi:VCBS repeat-containing protein
MFYFNRMVNPGSKLVCTTMAAAVLLLAACGGIGPNPEKPAGPAPPGQPAPPEPPLISAQSFTATEDTDFSATLAALAGANATLTVTANPSSGSLSAFAGNGTFTYRPAADFSGADTFTVEAVDSANKRASATITVNVTAVNDAPVAAGEVIEVASAAEAVLPVLGNDVDVDDVALSLVLVATDGASPALGNAIVDDSNRIRLTLPADFTGSTQVRYRVRDASGAESAEVTAIAFVGMPPQNLWYVAPGSQSSADLFVTDFLETRQVTQFTSPRGAGNVIVSANRRTLLVPEREEGNVRALWAVDTASGGAPMRVSPEHGENRAIGRYVLSPDGERAAWLVGDAAQVPELWVADVATGSSQRVTLPVETLNLATIQLMRFSPDSRSLYFGVVTGGGNTALMRVPTDTPGSPSVVYPRAGETGSVTSFFIAPDESYVVVQGRHLFRVPIGSAAPRERLNAALAPGQSVVAPSTNRDVTRFVYRTTDGRLWTSSLSAPDSSTLILDRDASRGVPGIEGVRPDGGAALISIPSLSRPGQVDLAELLLSPVSSPELITAPDAGNVITSNHGQYLDDFTALHVERSDSQPTRLFEFRRGLGASVPIGEPGVSGAAIRYSADSGLVTYMQASGGGQQAVVVSRAAPGAAMRVTPVIPTFSGYDVVSLTERR